MIAYLGKHIVPDGATNGTGQEAINILLLRSKDGESSMLLPYPLLTAIPGGCPSHHGINRHLRLAYNRLKDFIDSRRLGNG